MEFEKLVDRLDHIEVNTTAAREHGSNIERQIRVIKERSRAVVSTLPFSHLHKQIVIHLVYFAVLWLNAFPAKNGISDKLSPREIVTHKKLDYVKHCQVNFGSYVEAMTLILQML